MDRCGTCKNCIDLQRVKSRVLACCNSIRGQTPAGAVVWSHSRVDDGVVALWNAELARLPCLNPKPVSDK